MCHPTISVDVQVWLRIGGANGTLALTQLTPRYLRRVNRGRISLLSMRMTLPTWDGGGTYPGSGAIVR